VTGQSFRARLAGARPQVGMWVASGSAYCAEICAGSGLDWLLIDAEHAPNDLRSILDQLQAVAPYPVAPVVRPPTGDPVVIKQLLDIGAQTLIIPMVDSAEQAELLVRAVRYPPRGMRGVGSALGRASRWNRTAGYLQSAEAEITLIVQIESVEGLAQLEQIAAVDGIDAVFIGPSDLAASLGHLGQQDHPDVVGAVERAITAAGRVGRPAGVNAFVDATARRYIECGCRFILVGADVTLLARGSETLARAYIGDEDR
jgi:4-hydroxy-2-oxoheptanedioate aldolase